MDYSDIVKLGIGTTDPMHGWQEALKLANPAAGTALTRVIPGETWERLLLGTTTLTCSAVAGIRQPVFNLLDGDGNTLYQIASGPQLAASSQMTAFLAVGEAAQIGPAPSQQATASVTGPGAGATITSIALPAGIYTVNWLVGLRGTTAAVDGDNFQLVIGATVLAQSISLSASGTEQQQQPIQVEVAVGGQTLSIQAIAAATATAVYRAQLVAVPDSGASWYARIPDIVMPSGWQVQVTATGLLAGDQFSGSTFVVQRFPSDFASGDLYHEALEGWRKYITALNRGEMTAGS